MVKLCLRLLLVLCILPAPSYAQDAQPNPTQEAPGAPAAAPPTAASPETEPQEPPPAAPANTAPLPVKYSPEGYPILADGTPIRLRLTRTLSSADCKVGDRIDFEVVEPVILDGITVVPQGGIAWGTVTDAEHKKRMTRGGKLAIEIHAVQLANSEKAKLRADREAKGGGHTGVMAGAMVGTAIVFWPVAPVFLLMHGKEAKIPAGTEITAYVDGDTVFPTAAAPPAPAQPAPAQAAQPQPVPPTVTPPVSQPIPQPVQPQSEADASGAQLSLTSAPDGADVEVDGAFIGSTPSTIPIASGDHTVRISKKGFQDWQRKVKVSGGSISLHAELDPVQ